jgi:hypothetical protein
LPPGFFEHHSTGFICSDSISVSSNYGLARNGDCDVLASVYFHIAHKGGTARRTGSCFCVARGLAREMPPLMIAVFCGNTFALHCKYTWRNASKQQEKPCGRKVWQATNERHARHAWFTTGFHALGARLFRLTPALSGSYLKAALSKAMINVKCM